MPKILIIIPCYNEQESIGALLKELLEIGNSWFEIVVINDGSSDKTATVVTKYNTVSLVNLPVNLGIGGAVQTGFKYALENNFDVAIQVDGDGQHPASEIPKLLKVYDETHANIVIGSRFITKQGFQSSALRRLGIFYLHWLNKILTQKNIYDITSGFRLFDKKAIALSARYYPDEYPEPESLVIFAKAGFSIVETSVIMKSRQGGKSSIQYFSQLYYMIKVTIAMFFSYIRKVK
ncbi:MAG TPA: glycosyltransferase family 2 protein [Leadbetterella sp.]|nr:glycosyltransferase family 2 protein [Leadbetterella sp.]